jgi:hypothetical protein
MAVNAARTITINLTGDVISDKIYSAAQNATSPGAISIIDLALGANTITLPVSVGMTVKAATIIPPSGNLQSITLKGIAGDTGILLHKTDPTSIGFDTPAPISFVLTAGATINGVRIVWT